MAPHHYGALPAAIAGWAYGRRPDVEHEAILALGRQIVTRNGESARGRWRSSRVALGCAVSVFKGFADAAPISRVRRRHEPVRAGCVRSVRYSLERFDSAVVYAANFAKRRFGDDKLGVLGV